MLKHYIHCHEGYNLHKGGSVGYLSTLYASFERYGSFQNRNGIQNCFLFPNLKEGERAYNRALENIIHEDFEYVNNFTNAEGMQVLINERKRWFREILPLSEYGKIDYRNMRSVHIHGAYNFLPIFNTLKREGIEKQVVKILTTHNPHKPELEDMELISRGRAWNDADIGTLEYFFQQRDYWAFKLADALMFPSEFSMEGYFRSWPEFENIIKDKKIYFCTTSGQEKEHNIDNNVMRKSLNIPEDATVFLYLGRFVNIRGYDILVEAAKQIIPMNKNVYFVVVGESTQVAGFNTPQWIQIPFTKTPGNYLNMADACLCPNRGSLFDLSMIEIMASATPLLACHVGGYKWLKDKTGGVIFAEPESVDDFVRAIMVFLAQTNDAKKSMSQQNKQLYEDQLHLKYFYERYNQMIEQVYSDFGIEDAIGNNVSRLSVGFERNYKRNNEQQEFLVLPPQKPQPVASPIKTEKKIDSKSNVVAQSSSVDNKSNVAARSPVVQGQSDKNNLTRLQRNLRKAKRDPKLFFSDVLDKRLGKVKDLARKKLL